MSAEGSTRKGALPPNSIEVRSTRSEAWASRVRPTPVDPVKETFRSRASAIRVELRVLESEVTTQLTTPRGRPASRSEERRVGKECRARGARCHGKERRGE